MIHRSKQSSRYTHQYVQRNFPHVVPTKHKKNVENIDVRKAELRKIEDLKNDGKGKKS